MKKKNRILIIITVAVVVAAALIAYLLSRPTFKQDYHIEDIASITKIFLADKENNEVTLTRVSDSSWVVDNQYPASQPMVDLLLETIHDMRIRQQVNKNAAPNAIKDIAAHGVKVEIYQNDPFINWFGGRLKLFTRERLTTTYYVGRETQDMMASFMYRKGDDAPYIIHIPGFRGFLTPRFVTDPLKWRSHTIVDLNVREIERIEVEIPSQEDESFAIMRDGEGFAMEMLQNHQRVEGFDTARVAQMLSSFTWLNFDEFAAIVPNSLTDSCVSGTPRTILRITDINGNLSEVKTYIKYNNPDDIGAMPDPELYDAFDLNRLYAIVSHGNSSTDNPGDTVLIQYFVFDNILQPASYFRGAEKAAIAQ